MPFFESKPKLSIQECCSQFYDSNIFKAIIVGQDAWAGLLEIYFESVAEFDQSFLSIDPTLFRNEMTALRMEQFAFALGCLKKFAKEKKYTIPLSIYTRQYLDENGRLDIWDIMLEYNHIIARSATVNAKGETTPGAFGRAQVTFINEIRAGVFEDWMKANVVHRDAMTQEEEDKLRCAVRVHNRMGADIKRADSVVVKLLAARLAERLGCAENLNSDALFRLAAIIFGFYQGAEEYLKSVNLQG